MLIVFFFLMIRRPPRSPLFPYPTLSRSGGCADHRRHPPLRPEPEADAKGARPQGGRDSVRPPRPRRPVAHHLRSEEHTSELQSRQYLVCRLLLEKKKIYLPKTSALTRNR